MIVTTASPPLPAAPSPPAAPRPARVDDESSIKDAVSCVDAFNRVMFCGSPGHQFDRYYKDGALDGCGRPLAELGFCLRLKTAGPQDTRVRTRASEQGGAAGARRAPAREAARAGAGLGTARRGAAVEGPRARARARRRTGVENELA